MATPKGQGKRAHTALLETSERPTSIGPPPGLQFESPQSSDGMEVEDQGAAMKEVSGQEKDNG